jgi:regulator of protease activity HflC (stomatin/prohibitin superfamily)
VVAEVLKPGKYNLNPYAYDVELYPVTEVPAGHVGVVVDRAGLEQTNFDYISRPGYKGVQPEVREPGTYYMNPYTHEIIPYNIRVQKTDFENENEINFMSFDSYEIGLNATVEWRVERERVPEVYVRIGDLKDVERKFIIPYARSFCRIIGSASHAIDYISGDSRQAIQKNFHKMLEEVGAKNGIIISSVLIRRIIPPQVLREIINVRGLEKEKREKFIQEIEKVKSDAQVAKRKEEIIQSQARVEENISKQMALIKMKGDREIMLQQANKNKAIAVVNFDVADVERQTIAERGRASIMRDFNVREAEVEALKARVESFGGGAAFARYNFNQRLRIDSVLTSDQSPIAEMLNRYGSIQRGGQE